MPINVQCDQCERRLRVGDNLAGKKIKCPQCQNVLTVGAPETEEAPAPAKSAKAETPVKKTPTAPTKSSSAGAAATPKTSAAAKTPAATPKKKAEAYYVKTEDEEYYGPVPKTELDEWVTEGRLSAECQLLLDGSDQWLWASDVYPQLSGGGEEKSSEFSMGSADEDADTVAFKFSDISPKSAPAEEESEEAPMVDDEEAAPTVSKKSNSKSKKKGKGAADDGETSDRELMTAGLLAIFLGAFGAHRFYMGYVMHGILQAVTCGGAGIWQLIDVIMILTGKLPDVNGRPLKK